MADKPSCTTNKTQEMESYALADESDDESEENWPPVVEWPNILSEPNYHKIGDNREILLSWEDRLVEEIAKRSLRRVNKKFKIAVPFRNVEMHVPNNSQISERRLEKH